LQNIFLKKNSDLPALYAAKLTNSMNLLFTIAKATFKSELAYYCDKFDVKFALTTDCWTATNQQAYMGTTIHYINKNWKMESKLLDIVEMKESHSGLYLFRKLTESLKDFEIENRIIRSVQKFKNFLLKFNFFLHFKNFSI